MSYIYKIVNDIDNKVYVGKTDFSVEKRFKEHCNDAFRDRNKDRPLYSAIKKYGVNHFRFEIIEETCNPEEREIYWIDRLNSCTKGYNVSKGGDGKLLYDHDLILNRLKVHPYPCDVALEFGCCPDTVRSIAKQNGIDVKHKAREVIREQESKRISAYTKTGDVIQTFSSTADAARWCFENKKCKTQNSGVRAHISEAANGKRKTAYTYVWRYE